MQTKGRFDPNSPEIKAYLDKLAQQFVGEGLMVAFPMCLPGMTTPIPHDESRITALDVNAEGHIYGGTSGGQAHLFAAAFHGLTGIRLEPGPSRAPRAQRPSVAVIAHHGVCKCIRTRARCGHTTHRPRTRLYSRMGL